MPPNPPTPFPPNAGGKGERADVIGGTLWLVQVTRWCGTWCRS